MTDQRAGHNGDSKPKNAPGRKQPIRRALAWSLDHQRIRRAAVAIWMNVLIAAVVSVAALTTGVLAAVRMFPDPTWAQRALTVFAIWLLSFVPGWLYVRFLCLRKEALWNEYVLNLYRLGVDEPEYLPPPPGESAYARLPDAARGGSERTNIYRQKFNAYYGRKISAGLQPAAENDYVHVDTLFPVYLCTAALAVTWTAILWNPAVVMTPVEPWATLEFGFFGAYAFAVSMLVRRFYQGDLRPSAYAAVVLRIVLVLVILTVLHQLFAITTTGGSASLAVQYVTAFVVGFFPLAGLQALQRIAAKALRVVVPTMSPEYPLEQIDGLNIWYEARLIEEGVEDMQNLTTINLVDVILHTRAPVGRLIDWIDQAFLLIHLNPVNRKQLKQARGSAQPDAGAAATRVALRRIGIRSATDLLRAFPPPSKGRPVLPAESLAACGLDKNQLATLVRLLGAEPGLNPVWNWKQGGAARVGGPRLELVPATRRAA
ncbi:MAG TPA: hypothetical protein VFU35_15665 [Jatrophihabitans sp.]|nr:hypothetical protein [Jatrophihabitans sp.]